MIELGLFIRLARLLSLASNVAHAARAVPGTAAALIVLLSGQVSGQRHAGRS